MRNSDDKLRRMLEREEKRDLREQRKTRDMSQEEFNNYYEKKYDKINRAAERRMGKK